jgi:serine/threonine protein kinase
MLDEHTEIKTKIPKITTIDITKEEYKVLKRTTDILVIKINDYVLKIFYSKVQYFDEVIKGKVINTLNLENIITHTDYPLVTTGKDENNKDLTYSAIKMPYIEGKTLHQVKNPPLKVFSSLAQILGSLHRNNIAFIDLKPHNVIVTPDNKAFLIDIGSLYIPKFGLKNNFIMGTPQFMPPSYISYTTHGFCFPKDFPYTAIDVWAFGVMMYCKYIDVHFTRDLISYIDTKKIPLAYPFNSTIACLEENDYKRLDIMTIYNMLIDEKSMIFISSSIALNSVYEIQADYMKVYRYKNNKVVQILESTSVITYIDKDKNKDKNKENKQIPKCSICDGSQPH